MADQMQQTEFDKHTIAQALGPKITDAFLSGLNALGVASDNIKAALKTGGNGRRIVRVALHSIARFAIVEIGMNQQEFTQQAGLAFQKAYQKVAPKVDVDGDPSPEADSAIEVCESCGYIECECDHDDEDA